MSAGPSAGVGAEGVYTRGITPSPSLTNYSIAYPLPTASATLLSSSSSSSTAPSSYSLSSSSLASAAKQAHLLRDLAVKRRARSIPVPTNDNLVRKRLRELNEPITLFGERAPGRRERLGMELAKRAIEKEEEKKREKERGEGEGGEGEKEEDEMTDAENRADSVEVQAKAFLTPGTELLRQARLSFANYSLSSSRSRLAQERQRILSSSSSSSSSSDAAMKAHKQLCSRLEGLTISESHVGDVRPLSGCVWSPNGEFLCTSSWSSVCKIWNVPSPAFTSSSSSASNVVCELRGHTWNVSDVVYHPRSGAADWSRTSVNLATAGMDGKVILWPAQSLHTDVDMSAQATDAAAIAREKVEEEHKEPDMSDTNHSSSPSTSSSSSSSTPSVPFLSPLTVLSGHTSRCSRVVFHPSGTHLASSSFDHTFRLWDLETSQCLLSQPGHSYGVYALGFQGDGSLLLSGDLGGVGHVWDVRTGRIALSLIGHAKQMLGVDWHKNGYVVASCADDPNVKVWDIRQRKCLYTIAAHNKLISSVKWQTGDGVGGIGGEYLVSSSYDHSIRIWDGYTFGLIRTLNGHHDKVMRVDVSRRDGIERIVSCGFDRTWKLWEIEGHGKVKQEMKKEQMQMG